MESRLELREALKKAGQDHVWPATGNADVRMQCDIGQEGLEAAILCFCERNGACDTILPPTGIHPNLTKPDIGA